jgi:hypothetical protein
VTGNIRHEDPEPEGSKPDEIVKVSSYGRHRDKPDSDVEVRVPWDLAWQKR